MMLNTLLRLGNGRRRQFKAVLGLALLSTASVFSAAAQAEVIPPPPSLSHLSVPEPSNLSHVVKDKSKAIALGKALFWDMRVGSDGAKACASCHFSAGADPRLKNQLSPSTNGNSYAFGGANYTLKATDFPFVKFANNNKHFSTKERDFKIVSSSAGVFQSNFKGVNPGEAEDVVELVHDLVFNVDGTTTRRVEPRNAPTVINAIFNFRTFWDGRAQNVFNGVNIWGKRDKHARVFKSYRSYNPYNWKNEARPYDLKMRDASIASLSVGPALSDFEMSAHGRDFPQLGRKMLSMRALENQKVAHDDSVLGAYRHSSGLGLNHTYHDMIKQAFRPEWWNANRPVSLNGQTYSQMEANFSLYFGLALQMYQATLVSGHTPYDSYADGDHSKLSHKQQLGFSLFMGKGKCVGCHSGANFSSASFENKGSHSERMSRMTMGNHKSGVYDEGFYNIGVTRTEDDLGVGGNDIFGNPLSFSAFSKKDYGVSLYYAEGHEHGNVRVKKDERIAVKGAFKAPTLRNVALTAPYFHNGSAANLMQVVEFYNRGGNFPQNNIDNLDADIQPLHLSQSEKEALVAFLESLTDHRVTKHKAPFDHPELIVDNGHIGDENYAENDQAGFAIDDTLYVPAVGRHGYANADVTFNEMLGLNHYKATKNSEPDSPKSYNISEGKHAKQSSEAYYGKASRAVDGNIEGHWYKKSVTHTRYDTEAWWQVDLAKVHKITEVDIYGRTDCCTSRLENFGLAISPNDMTGKSVAQLKADPSVKWVSIEALEEATGSFHFNEIEGRYVRVMLEGRNYLNLAEVEVHGFDPDAKPITDKYSIGTSALFGQAGAATFTDPMVEGQKLTGIRINAGWWIDAIQGLAEPIDLPRHGGHGGGVYTVTWPEHEYLVRVYGKHNGHKIGQLTFVTNTGRKMGPYGLAKDMGHLQSFDYTVPAGAKVLGFTGRAGSSLDALGLIYGTKNTHEPVPVQAAKPVLCAKTWGTCTIPAGKTATVTYGTDGKYSKANVTGRIACNRYTFGASLFSGARSCYYTLPQSPK